MIKTVDGVKFWIREIPRHGYFVFRERPDPRPWIDPWWEMLNGPFDTEAQAVETL
jgi:hypothetical protein